VTLNAIAPEALQIDEKNNEQFISAKDGTYTLTLPGATCSAGWCFIDGAPRVLVENGTAGEQIVQTAAAEVTVTPNETVSTPLAADSITPSLTPSPTLTLTPTTIVSPALTATFTPQAEVTATATATSTPSPLPTAVNIAAVEPPAPPPTATPTAEPAVPPAREPISVNSDLATIFTPNRILLLVIIGVLLFTFFYFIQYRLWTNHRH
jgi:hypothetical protein